MFIKLLSFLGDNTFLESGRERSALPAQAYQFELMQFCCELMLSSPEWYGFVGAVDPRFQEAL